MMWVRHLRTMALAGLLVASVAVSVPTGAAAAPAPRGPLLVTEEIPAGAQPGGPAPLPAAVAAAEVAANRVVCEGDGVAGKRIELLYMREPSWVDRYDRYLPSFPAWAAAMDDAYSDSAAQTGGSRHLRFVTAPAGTGCQVVVRRLDVPEGTFAAGWQSMKDAAANQGYHRTDRKYLFLTENTQTCGGAQGDDDDRPGPENRFNTGPHYAEIAAPCWGSNGIGHELAHILGAVLAGAPHGSTGGHCTQEWDLMCYGDVISTFPCDEKDADRLLDCDHDDYYSTNPPAGSWLATHWNVANSDFLIKGSVPDNDDGHLRGGRTLVLTNVATGNAMLIVMPALASANSGTTT